MTVEELISTVREALRVSTDYDPYAEGYQDALIWFSDMLDQLEPRWHPFPEEKPPFNRVILFKFKDNYFELVNYTEHTTFSVDPINWWELSKEGGIK